jgi:hypothetical protein
MSFLVYTLLSLLLLSRTAYSATPIVLFTHQCQHITFQNWFNYITLCFAPLIAHIVAGVGSPIVIPSDSKLPSWSACIPHYNPISVVWRWYAIADRRFRAYNWDAADMAACNAVFWDSEKARWDGSEEIMLRSRAWLIKVPEQTYVPFLSASSLATVILTLQGVQASFIIFGSLDPDNKYHVGQGLSNVFIPIAILGLMRLPAALWLSDDYGYLDIAQKADNSGRNAAETPAATMEDVGDPLLELEPRTSKRSNATTTTTTTTIVSPLSIALSNLSELTTTDKRRLRSSHSPLGLVYRIWWFFSIAGLLSGAAVSTSHLLWGNSRSFPFISLSHLLVNILYFVISTATVLMTSTYIFLGRTTSTLIPCIHATWYKVFTVVLAAMGLVIVVVSALETRQLYHGNLSSLPEFQCNNTTGFCIPAAQGHGNTNL